MSILHVPLSAPPDYYNYREFNWSRSPPVCYDRSERVWCVDSVPSPSAMPVLFNAELPLSKTKRTSTLNLIIQGRETTWIRHTLSNTGQGRSSPMFVLSRPRLTSADLTASMLAFSESVPHVHALHHQRGQSFVLAQSKKPPRLVK